MPQPPLNQVPPFQGPVNQNQHIKIEEKEQEEKQKEFGVFKEDDILVGEIRDGPMDQRGY